MWALQKLLDSHDVQTSIVDTNLQIFPTTRTTWPWLTLVATPPDMEELQPHLCLHPDHITYALTHTTAHVPVPTRPPPNMIITPHESMTVNLLSYIRLWVSRGG